MKCVQKLSEGQHFTGYTKLLYSLHPEDNQTPDFCLVVSFLLKGRLIISKLEVETMSPCRPVETSLASNASTG